MADDLDTVVLDALRPAERATAVAYVDGRLRPRGPLEIGGLEVELAGDAHVAFVDQAPGANWMHPVRYLLIDAQTQAVRELEAMQPPAFGALPATWRIVARAPDVEDWQLLPITSSD